MRPKSNSLVARTALALVALAGVVAAVPASARSFDGDGRGGREHDRVAVERDYRQVDYRPVERGYGREWRHAPVVEWHAHYGHDSGYGHDRDRGRW